METLNDQDLDWLTATENKLIRLRKREAANTNSQLMIEEITEAIEKVDSVREWLGARLERPVETLPKSWG